MADKQSWSSASIACVPNKNENVEIDNVWESRTQYETQCNEVQGRNTRSPEEKTSEIHSKFPSMWKQSKIVGNKNCYSPRVKGHGWGNNGCGSAVNWYAVRLTSGKTQWKLESPFQNPIHRPQNKTNSGHKACYSPNPKSMEWKGMEVVPKGLCE